MSIPNHLNNILLTRNVFAERTKHLLKFNNYNPNPSYAEIMEFNAEAEASKSLGYYPKMKIPEAYGGAIMGIENNVMIFKPTATVAPLSGNCSIR